MIASHYIEIYTLVVGWNMYEAIFTVLVDTGIAFVPFIFLLVNGIFEVLEDNSTVSMSSGVLVKLVQMSLVVGLCVIPVGRETGIQGVSWRLGDTDCNLASTVPTTVGHGDVTGTTYDDAFGTSLQNTLTKQPFVWYGVNYLSSAITHAAIKSVGCSNNYEMMLLRVSEARIQDPNVRKRIKDFQEVCYLPARARFLENAQDLSDATMLSNIDWIGSSTLLNTPGEYYQHKDSYATNMQKYGFTRDTANREADMASYWGANPSCKEVWEGENGGSAIGLRALILGSIDKDKMGDIKDDWNEWGSEMMTSTVTTQAEKEDLLIRMILESDEVNLKNNTDIDIGSDYEAKQDRGKWKILGEMVMGAAGLLTGFDTEGATIKAALKYSGPIVIAIVQMIVIVAAPILMVLSGYKFSTFAALALTYFAFEFINAIYALAYWVDNRLLMATLNSSNGFLDKAMSGTLIYVVSVSMIVLLPMLWLGLFSYAGSGMVRGLSGSNGGAGATPVGAGSKMPKNPFAKE